MAYSVTVADTATAEKWSTRIVPSLETSNDPPDSGLNV